jgi:isopenicillin-N epimerase
MPDAPSPSPFAALWPLDPAVAYLNHGSFGACPTALLEHQHALRLELEREPVDFLSRGLAGRLASARGALAAFVGADPDDLAFVVNATAGVGTVLRSLRLGPGDELLTTNHAYGACRKTLEYVATLSGATVVSARVPFPLRGAEDVVEPVLAALTPRTRLALLDHVTSPTGLIFPIERLVRELAARGVDTLVDGAHALGMLPLELGRLGAAYYTANAHKWLCAPKGAAFLFVRRDRQQQVHPLVISHGYHPNGEAFRAEFDWTGTADPSAWLSIPACLAFLGDLLPGGFAALMAHNHALALRARAILCDAVGTPPPCPDDMIGALASVPLPKATPGSPVECLDHERLADWFRERGIETWASAWPSPSDRLIRASAQLYNTEAQYHRLAEALREALRGA